MNDAAIAPIGFTQIPTLDLENPGPENRQINPPSANSLLATCVSIAGEYIGSNKFKIVASYTFGASMIMGPGTVALASGFGLAASFILSSRDACLEGDNYCEATAVPMNLAKSLGSFVFGAIAGAINARLVTPLD